MQQQNESLHRRQLPLYIQQCSSDNPDIQIENARNIRRILGYNDPPISEVVSSGICRLIPFKFTFLCLEYGQEQILQSDRSPTT